MPGHKPRLSLTLNSVTTEVRLGCGVNCASSRILGFPLSAVVLLTGVDTTGVPMGTTETKEIGGSYRGQHIEGSVAIAATMTVKGVDCSPDNCPYTERIKSVAEALETKPDHITIIAEE